MGFVISSLNGLLPLLEFINYLLLMLALVIYLVSSNPLLLLDLNLLCCESSTSETPAEQPSGDNSSKEADNNSNSPSEQQEQAATQAETGGDTSTSGDTSASPVPESSSSEGVATVPSAAPSEGAAETVSGEIQPEEVQEASQSGGFASWSLAVDYTQVHLGLIVLLVNGLPFLSLNLAWLFGSMTRSSRKKLSKWLEQKEITGGFPLQPPNLPATADPSSTTPQAGGVSEGQVNTNSSGTSKSMQLTIKRVYKLLGLDLSVHSNAVLDALRIYFNKNEVTLFQKNSNNKFERVNLERVVESIVAKLKAQRSEKKGKKSGLNG